VAHGAVGDKDEDDNEDNDDEDNGGSGEGITKREVAPGVGVDTKTICGTVSTLSSSTRTCLHRFFLVDR